MKKMIISSLALFSVFNVYFPLAAHHHHPPVNNESLEDAREHAEEEGK